MCPVSTKHDPYPQVRIHPEVQEEIIRLQTKSGYKMSRTAYVDSLLRKGIEVEKEAQAILRKIKHGK